MEFAESIPWQKHLMPETGAAADNPSPFSASSQEDAEEEAEGGGEDEEDVPDRQCCER